MTVKKTDFVPMKTNARALIWCHHRSIVLKFSKRKVYIIHGKDVLSEGNTLLKAINCLIEYEVKSQTKVARK